MNFLLLSVLLAQSPLPLPLTKDHVKYELGFTPLGYPLRPRSFDIKSVTYQNLLGHLTLRDVHFDQLCFEIDLDVPVDARVALPEDVQKELDDSSFGVPIGKIKTWWTYQYKRFYAVDVWWTMEQVKGEPQNLRQAILYVRVRQSNPPKGSKYFQ